jgi:hypothetical protein
MQLADLTLNASIFGFIPTIGNNLFPVHVRATGEEGCLDASAGRRAQTCIHTYVASA